MRPPPDPDPVPEERANDGDAAEKAVTLLIEDYEAVVETGVIDSFVTMHGDFERIQVRTCTVLLALPCVS